MLTTVHVKAEIISGVPVALLTTEKVGEYECTAIEHDLLKIAESCRYRYVVDFTQVKLLSSVGIGLLIKLQKTTAAGKGKLVLCGLDPNILKLLQMTRLDKGLTIVATRDAAIKLFHE